MITEDYRTEVMLKIIILHFRHYIKEESNPTIEGFMEYVAVEEEIENDEIAEALAETEEYLIRELHK